MSDKNLLTSTEKQTTKVMSNPMLGNLQ